MSISKLYDCMKTKKVNNSQAREAIYFVLLKSDNCLSVSEITQRLQDTYARKVSLNTIYRHLTLFTECGLVVVIQDDFKKAYYTLTGNKALAFALCPKCNYVSMVKETNGIGDLLSKLDSMEFITVHKRCESCK